METATDSIKAVAEAKCSNECEGGIYHADLGRGEIEPVQCFQGCIGLKHPSLSRECPGCSGNGYTISLGTLMKWGCRDCGGSSNGNSAINGSGRIPDVTLEKVLLEILHDTPNAPGHPLRLDGRLDGEVWIQRPGVEPVFKGTILEAACSALMADVPSLHG